MKTLPLQASLACAVAVLIGALFCASASAQIIAPPDGGDVLPELVPPIPPETVQPQKKSPKVNATDPMPAKRNPFWPIHVKTSKTGATTTNITREVAPPTTEVDWKEATKHLRTNVGAPSKIGSTIFVAFEGKMYEIGQLIPVPLNGNVYTFKVLEGGTKFEQQSVRPEEQ